MLYTMSTVLALQTAARGSTPPWFILILLFLIIALFWWGLNRPSYEQTAAGVAEDEHHTVSEHHTTDDHAVVAAAEPVTPDDLKIIEGIGPKIEQLLQAAGIHTFAELAATSVSQLSQIVREDAGLRIAFPASWPQQAQMAAAGDWEALQTLQEQLNAGRH
jgi:predicted flap endonuclease-1-like 5' DNA nuclease